MIITRQTVLVVEDNDLNLKLFEQVLVTGGFHPVTSSDGMDLVDLVRRTNPVCILMDIHLPTVSGFELLSVIRDQEDLHHIPVIAVAALTPDLGYHTFLEAGFDAFLPKPISVRVLLSTVTQLTARKCA